MIVVPPLSSLVEFVSVIFVCYHWALVFSFVVVVCVCHLSYSVHQGSFFLKSLPFSCNLVAKSCPTFSLHTRAEFGCGKSDSNSCTWQRHLENTYGIFASAAAVRVPYHGGGRRK